MKSTSRSIKKIVIYAILIIIALFFEIFTFRYLIRIEHTPLHALFGTLLSLIVLWLPVSILLKGVPFLKKEKESLEEVTNRLKETQNQLISQEKMASIGLLTAGIAHEIKNPLNFINNFSEITIELLTELRKKILENEKNLPATEQKNLMILCEDILSNCEKIHMHGQRAECTVKTMLTQASTSYVEKVPTDINALLEEYANLAYHGMRAQNSNFHAKINKCFDNTLSPITISPQNIGRVFLNIINNALYAINEKPTTTMTQEHEPLITITTEQDAQYVIIKIRDNGKGIPSHVRTRIFEPFFTTKPAGVGTGLGLHICYNLIVKEHQGALEVMSTEGDYTEFIIKLPKQTKS